MLVRSTVQNRPENFIYPKAYDNGERGIFACGGQQYRPPEVTSIYKCQDSCYISISTPGNSIVFGTAPAKTSASGSSGRGRGLIMGGQSGRWPSMTVHNEIDYVTISTPGNVTSFGDLTAGRTDCEACSDGIRALNVSGFAGGVGTSRNSWSQTQNVDYVTIATAANAGDFGDLSSSWSDGTHGVQSDGVVAVTLSSDGSGQADYLYFTISTLGNSTKWGDARPGTGMTGGVNSEKHLVSASDSYRGVYGGGNHGSINHTIDYITFATPSNGLQFGQWWIQGTGGEGGPDTEILQKMSAVNGPDGSSRAVVFPSQNSPVMKYFNIATAASTSTTHGTTFGTGGTGSWGRRNDAAGFAGD